jgi:lysophospholipase L1-like esterase
MIIKNSFLIASFLLLIIGNIAAQERFKTEVFTTLDTINAIPYSEVIDESGKIKGLLLNLLSPPKNDTMQMRPLLIFINGAHTFDARFSLDCSRSFSKKGYVTAVIPYRRFNKNTENALELDAKRAVIYFRKNAIKYRIDTTQIFIGGSGVGASAAMAVAYSPTKEASTKVHAVINLGGWINPSNIKKGNASLYNIASFTKTEAPINSNGYGLYKKCVGLGIGTDWKYFTDSEKGSIKVQKKIQVSIESISLWLFTQLRYNQINDRENVMRYEKEIIRFDSLNNVEKYPENAILFLGSSYIRLWTNIRKDLEYEHIIHRGFGGSNLKDVAYYIKRIVYPHNPKAIFMYVGNDIIVDQRDKTPNQALELFKYIVNTIRAKYSTVPITWLAISPSEKRWTKWNEIIALNKVIKDYCSTQHNLYFIDAKDQFLGADGKPIANLFRDDKLHYNEQGYQLWGARIKKDVKVIAEK